MLKPQELLDKIYQNMQNNNYAQAKEFIKTFSRDELNNLLNHLGELSLDLDKKAQKKLMGPTARLTENQQACVYLHITTHMQQYRKTILSELANSIDLSPVDDCFVLVRILSELRRFLQPIDSLPCRDDLIDFGLLEEDFSFVRYLSLQQSATRLEVLAMLLSVGILTKILITEEQEVSQQILLNIIDQLTPAQVINFTILIGQHLGEHSLQNAFGLSLMQLLEFCVDKAKLEFIEKELDVYISADNVMYLHLLYSKPNSLLLAKIKLQYYICDLKNTIAEQTDFASCRRDEECLKAAQYFEDVLFGRCMFIYDSYVMELNSPEVANTQLSEIIEHPDTLPLFKALVADYCNEMTSDEEADNAAKQGIWRRIEITQSLSKAMNTSIFSSPRTTALTNSSVFSRESIADLQQKPWFVGLTLAPIVLDWDSFFYAFAAVRKPEVDPDVLRKISVRHIRNNAADFAKRYCIHVDNLMIALSLFENNQQQVSLMIIDALSTVLRKTVVILSSTESAVMPIVLHTINPQFLTDGKIALISRIRDNIYQGLQISEERFLDEILDRFGILVPTPTLSFNF